MKSEILFSIILVASLVLVQTSLPDTEAVKSTGSKTNQYGANADVKVCGTYFCTTQSSQPKFDTNKPTQDDLNAVFNRMDKVHKQHQEKILEQWRLMSNTDRIRFLEVMNRMLSNMESMEMSSHIKQMMKSPELDSGHMMLPGHSWSMHHNGTHNLGNSSMGKHSHR